MDCGRRPQEAVASSEDPADKRLLFARRPPLDRAQTDVFAYARGTATAQADVFHFERREHSPQIDAFAYDVQAARSLPDVMGYQAHPRPEEVDAVAYSRPEPSAENDVFFAFRPVRTKLRELGG